MDIFQYWRIFNLKQNNYKSLNGVFSTQLRFAKQFVNYFFLDFTSEDGIILTLIWLCLIVVICFGICGVLGFLITAHIHAH